jgi:hypothetical protein
MARRRSAAPKEPKTVEWIRDELIEKILNEVAEEHHGHLERAKLVVVVKPRAGRKGCCGGLGQLKTPSRAMLALLKDQEIGEPSYILLLGRDKWEKLSPEARRRALDHFLCHAGGIDTDRGRWFKVEHDCEEFTAILKRHGVDGSPGLTHFVAQAKQLEIRIHKGGATA